MKLGRMMVVAAVAVSLMGIAAFSQGQVLVNGSTTVQPIANCIQNWFIVNDPAIDIVVEATGSGDGIAALINGTTDIAMHSRAMKTSEFGQAVENGVFPVIYTVARDKIAVAVNTANPITDISIDELSGIWMGTITNWSQIVDGYDNPILFASRDTSSGTFGVWKDLVLGGQDYSGTSVTVVASNSVMQETVASEPNAIGYVGLAYTEGVKIITVEGLSTAAADYPIARPLFISTNGVPEGDVAKVVNAFMGLVGGCCADQARYIPVWACPCSCDGVLPE